MEEPADKRQVFGQEAVASPAHLDAEELGGGALQVESARLERGAHPFGMAARQPLGAGAGLAGAGEALPHAGEGTAADPMLECEQQPFKPKKRTARRRNNRRNAAKSAEKPAEEKPKEEGAPAPEEKPAENPEEKPAETVSEPAKTDAAEVVAAQ